MIQQEQPHSRIAGNVAQKALTSIRGAQNQVQLLKQQTESLFRNRLDQLNIYHSMLFLSSAKFLVSDYNEGEQPKHWDSNIYENVTCLLYCTDCMSTSLPIFPSNLLGASEFDNVQLLRNQAFLLQQQFFHSIPVQAGTIIMFKHSTPHSGVMNDNLNDQRIVLFSMLSNTPDNFNSNQDAYQLFEWQFMKEAYKPYHDDDVGMMEEKSEDIIVTPKICIISPQ